MEICVRCTIVTKMQEGIVYTWCEPCKAEHRAQAPMRREAWRKAFIEKNAERYKCTMCGFKTYAMRLYRKHIASARHDRNRKLLLAHLDDEELPIFEKSPCRKH